METFPDINPSYSLIKIPIFNTAIVDYGNKKEQRIARNSTVQWKFNLNWEKLTPADKATYKVFFIARKGAYEPFYWVNLEDSQTYTVKFEIDLINIEWFFYQLYNIQSVTFIEVKA